jgi:methionyl aminopeptidase
MHYGKKGTGEKIKAGMIFTIEPMINLGNFESKTLNDGWTAVTKDKSLSAQFEHTIGVTKNGCEVFTLSNKKN